MHRAAKKGTKRKATRALSDRGRERLAELLRGAPFLNEADPPVQVRDEPADVFVCSEYWVGAIVEQLANMVLLNLTSVQVNAAGYVRSKPHRILTELARRNVLPVPGQKPCLVCGAYYPAHYVNARDVCYDCELGAMSPAWLARLPRSSSAAAFTYLATVKRNGKGVRVKVEKTRQRPCGVTKVVNGKMEFVPLKPPNLTKKQMRGRYTEDA